MSVVQPTFIDLFSGCGGLSLGLMMAGWRGLFAIEKNPEAFKTLRNNLIDENGHNAGCPRFTWPEWLEVGPHEVAAFIRKQRRYLESIRGKVHLVAGGPPCQGFSFAGRRSLNDPRNELFRQHLRIVDILKPELVLMENVQGINTAFRTGKKRNGEKRGRPRKSYASRIFGMLGEHGYDVQQHVVRAVDFGVPQFRPRYFTLGVRQGLLTTEADLNLKKELYHSREDFLERRGLPSNTPDTVLEAISDLTTFGKRLVTCTDEESPPGFMEIVYEGPLTSYQGLMHKGMNGQVPNSLRLVNHRPETIARFKKILETCRKGVQLSDEDRARLGIKKTTIAPLSPNQPSRTLTTLPDDLLHYAEPRIHTVREYARLQSFPDWFEFRGNYTTGGDRRARECPRYTQVGNAVPPLLAEAMGEVLKEFLAKAGFFTRNGKKHEQVEVRGGKR
jgi:DNA (cytosine-5)-methyltransferase 1